MAARSPRIDLHTSDKIKYVNPENLELLKKYNVDMSIRDLSETTKYGYNATLKQWFVFILEHQQNRSVLTMDDEDMDEYFYWCKSLGNNANRMRFRMSSVGAFYKFLRHKKYLKNNPIEFAKRPKKSTPIMVQTFLTNEQIALMREKLIAYGDLQLRVYATLSLSTMARVAAIASLRWNQIDIEHCVIHDVLEKEGKVVDLYFNDEVKQILIQLKEERKEKNVKDYGWLFYTNKINETRHIHKNTLGQWCKKIGEMIGINSFHHHDYRHTAATMLHNAGMPLEDISVLLNHESTDTTKKFYIKQDKARINDMKNRFNL